MKRTIVFTVLAITLGVLIYMHPKQSNNNTTSVVTMTSEVAIPTVNDLTVIAGAKPSMNRSQRFLPPIGSVVVTNETQLRELINKSRSQTNSYSK